MSGPNVCSRATRFRAKRWLRAPCVVTPNRLLRSITLSTAEILRVNQQVGSLETGKDATLFIANGDILDVRTQVTTAFIQGRKVDLSDRHKTLYSKYQNKYRQKGFIE